MITINSARLTCTQITERDWDFFHALQTDPQVMYYVADMPDAQGQGYGTESLRAVCDYAFREGGINRLIATVTAGNLASRSLLEKVGFTLEQELHESYRLRDQLHNDWLFGMMRHA